MNIASTMATTMTTEEREARNPTYLASRLQSGQTIDGQNLAFEIPIIDLAPSFESLAGRQQVAAKIRAACLSSGFFYITSHGINQAACDGILEQGARLFKRISAEAKQKIHIQHSPHGYGWESSDSTSIAGDIETKEAFNWSYSSDLDPTGGDGQYVQLDGSHANNLNQWPTDLPTFYDGVRNYYGQALQLARHLCRLFALSLHLPEDYFDAMTTHPSANARIMYYPPSKGVANDVSVGLGAHTDYQCFTILLCSSTPGLEILSPAGQWVGAPTVKGGLVVNIADMMMRWTNASYKSTIHWVVNRSEGERYSVPLFFGVNNEQVVDVRDMTFPSMR